MELFIFNSEDIHCLANSIDLALSSIWKQTWKRKTSIGLQREEKQIWNQFVQILQQCPITLRDVEDQIIRSKMHAT